MPISKSALKNIYATLQKGGYTQDYETFENGFTGNEHYANRKKVYDLLTANGAQIGDSYEDFMRRIYVAPAKPAAAQTAHPQQTTQAAAPVQRAPAAKPKPRNGRLTAAQRQAYIARAQQMSQQVGASVQRTNNRMDYERARAGLRTPRVQLGSKASGGAKLGENSRVVATQPKFNPATGKMERTYLTESGNEYTSRAAADLEQNEIDQAVQQQLYPGYNNYNDKQAVAAQAPATAVAAQLWKEAQNAYDADRNANAKEVYGGNPWLRGGREMHVVDGTINSSKNEESRLKHFDLQKMSDNAWARVGKQMTASCYARLRKMYPNALERQVQASAEKEARALVQNAVYKYAVKMNAPKSQLEYFLRKAVDANLLTSVLRGMARYGAGTTGDMAAYEAANEEYGKSHRWTGVFGTATGMAFDPTNWVGVYVGSLGGRAALNIGGRFVLGSAPGVGARLFGSTMAGRLATGAASGMGMMGTYEGVKEAERQWVYGGHVNPETRENEGYSAGAVALSALKGAGLGAATGMVSALVGNVADKVVHATTSATGKVAARLGEVATSAVAEGTIFAMPAVISGQESFVDAWTESMAMIVGFKGQHMVKSAGQVIAGMRPVANPRTMEERNRNRRGFAENLKRTMDAGANKQWNGNQPDVRFTKEELAELKQMGYGNLASLLTPTEKVLPKKKPCQPKHPKNTDGLTVYFDVGSGKKEAEADPKMKWLQQHPEFDGYATMEKLMQDPNVSQAARAKAYYMLTGRQLPMGTITGWNVGKDDKGNIWVKSVTSEGEVVTSRRFTDEASAKREEAKIIRQVELNTVDMGEQYKEMQANAAVVETAIKAVAPNADVNEAMRVYGEVKKGNKDYDSYKDLAKSIDEAIASNPEAVERAKTLLPESIRKDIAEQTGVEVDKALGKPEAERTDAEKQAVQTYLERLYDKSASDDAATPPDAQLQGPEQFAEAYAKHRTHKGSGQVVPATMKAGDRKVYVIDGNVVQYADKSGIDVAKSDKSIVVCDAETGKYEYTSPDQLMNVGEPADPSTLSEAYMANERAKEAAANGEGTAEGNAAANGDVSADGGEAEVEEPAYTDGSRVEINGHEYDVKSAGEKTVVLVDEHGKELAWTRSALDAKLESGDAEVLEPKAEAAPDVATEDLKAGDVFEDSDGNALTVKRVDGDKVVAVGADGKEQTYEDGMFEQMVESGVLKRAQKTEEPSEAKVDLTDNQGNSTPQPDLYSESKGAEQSSGVQAEVPQAEVQENAPMPMRVVGKGKNAVQEEDWLATTPKRGHDYVFKESGLDAEEANAFVENKVAEAEKNLEKVKGKAPKMGTNIAAYKEAKADYEARVAEAQKAVDYWHAVKAERDKVLLEERRARKEKDKALYDDAVAQEEQRKAEMAQKAAEQEALGSNAVAPAIKEKWENAPKVDGGADEITLPNGEVVTGHYVLTESGAASASHQATNGFAETEGYPVDVNGETVNDRDYKRDAEAQQVTRGMAADYDSRALQSPVVVSGDGVVLSGNGRTMAGEIAALNGSDAKYNAYLRGHAGKFGFTTEQVEGFKHPRVVFVPDGEMPYTSETFAKFNQREQKSQSRTEMAVKLGKVVDDALLGRVMDVIGRHESLAEFYADDAATAAVVKELADAGVIPQTEMAQLFDGGRLSESGQAMVEGVLVGKVFQGSPDAVRQITEVKSMRKAVMAALPEVVACHRLGGGYDLSKELAAAVDLVYKARKAGFKLGQHVSQHARQGNLFQLDDGATVADYNNAAVMMLADVMNDGRVTQLKKVLSFYNTQAADSAQGIGDMFAGGVKSKGQIINEVNELLNNGQEYDRRTPSVADGQGVGGEGGEQGDVAGPSHQGGEGSERGLSEAFDGLAAQLKTAEGEERKRVLGEMRDGIARFAEENGYPVPEFLLTREDFLAAVPEKDRAKYVEWLDDGWHCPAYYEKGKVYYFVEGCDKFDKDVAETLAHEYTHADNAEFPENVNALTYALEDTHEVTRDELVGILETLSNSSHYGDEAERLESEGKNANPMLADEVIAHAVARMVRDGEQVLDGITNNPTLQFIIKRAYKVRENERRHNILAREASERSSKTIEGSEANSGNGQSVAEGESGLGRYGRSARSEAETGEQSGNGRSAVTNGKEVAAPSLEGAKVGVTDGEKSSATGDAVPSGKGNSPLSEKIATASAEVNTEPTEAQKEAGNYKKGHVQIGTFDITIEQPQGSVRKGTDADGKQWESKMNNTYGYIRGAVGVDGDHIDVFLSNDIDGWNGRKVFVVDQYNPDGSFDEHKVMLGFNDADEAKSDYLANYENGWENGRRIDVTAVNLEDFEKWIASSKRKTKPFGEYSSVKNGVVPSGKDESVERNEVLEYEKALDHLEDVEQKWGDKIQDYVYEHYPTQATTSAESTSEKGLQERKAMKADPVLKQMYAEAKKEIDAADEMVTQKYSALPEDLRQQKAVGKSAQPPTREESILRDVVIEHMKGSGLDVIGTEDGQRVLDMANDDGAKEHRVYHGSGAEFDHFDHSHMGEGEGAQAYGWGTYVTEVRGIGEGYAIRSKNGISMSREEWSLKRSELESNIYRAKEQLPFLKGEYKAEVEAQISEWEEQLKDYEPHNYLYTVEIPDDNGGNYLDWNGPVPAETIDRITEYLREKYGDEVVNGRWLSNPLLSSKGVDVSSRNGAAIYRQLERALGSDKKASQLLSSLGYAGIKYPAEFRSGGRKDDAKNYVIFNENDAEITDHVRFFKTKNGEAYGFTVGGKIYYDPRIANAETPVHEYAHLWASALKANNAKEWKNVVDLMKGTNVWEEVKKTYPELETDDEIADEVLATYSGRRGAERLREEMRKAAAEGDGVMGKAEAVSALQRVKRAIDKFWKAVADFLHIHYTSAEEVADRVMKDLLDGVDPRSMMDGGKSLRPETRINIVETKSEHGFKNYAEAKAWAKEHIARTYSGEETGGKGDIRISNAAVDKYLSQSAVDKSESKDVHLAVLKVLPDVIRESVDAEQHADFKKGEDGVRSAENGINPDVTIHRLYGAVRMDGKVYRVKVTLKENTRTKDTPKAYSYEATKIELLEGSLSQTEGSHNLEPSNSKSEVSAGQHGNVSGLTSTFPRYSDKSITAANLLNGVEKSYDGGKFFEDYNKIREQFIGEKGAERADHADEVNTRLDNLSVAREMEAEKKDAKAIKLATGWERGADGKWRYEIADMKEFDRNGNLLYRKNHPDYARYIELLDKEDANLFEGGEALTVEERAEFETLSKKYESDTFGGEKLDNNHTLEAYVDAPELFKAYPELKNVGLRFENTGGNEIASYRYISSVFDVDKDDVGEIVVNTGKVSKNTRTREVKSAVLHEMQHAIQEIEGFAGGGSPKSMQKRFEAAKEEWRARAWADALRDKADEMGEHYNQAAVEKALIDEYKEMGMDNDEWMPNKEIRMKGFNYFARGYADRSLDADIKNFRLNESTRADFSPYVEYTRLGGEVESRNVERRMGMSAEERRASLAAETEDVSREDQIFLTSGDGGETAHSVEMVHKPSKEESILRDVVIEHMKGSGLDVIGTEDGQRVLDMANDDGAKEHRVYHGSGAEFDHFDHSHMGEGEGAQAYGWGTYVTEVEGIGRTYAESARKKPTYLYGGKEMPSDEFHDYVLGEIGYRNENMLNDFMYNLERHGVTRAKDILKKGDLAQYKNLFYQSIGDTRNYAEGKIKAARTLLSLKGIRIRKPKSHLYTVEIPEDNGKNYLDWNSETGKDLVSRLVSILRADKELKESYEGRLSELNKELGKFAPRTLFSDTYVQLAELLGSDKKASQLLSSLGYAGIKYPAEFRSGGRKDDAKNYVIFNENDAEITDHVRFFKTKNGEAYGFTVGGKIYYDPRIANAETPVHEYAHLWASALKANNAKEWKNVVDLMKGTNVWEEVKKTYPELETDDEIADEVLATYSGRRGAERLREEMRKAAAEGDGVMGKAEAVSALQRVKRAIDKFWKAVADFLHIHYTSAEEVADRVMKDLLDGVDPRKFMGDKAQKEKMRYQFMGEKGAGENVRDAEDYTAFASRYGVSEDMVKDYALGMETGNLQKANFALTEIRRTMRVANRGMKLSEFGKLFRPVQEELAERYGDIEVLRQEYIDAEMRERGVMEAARKRAEEEAAERKARADELRLLPAEELDRRYFEAVERGDDAAAREMLDEAARRKGYGDTESEYQGVGAWVAPSNPGYESDAARRADVEDNAPDVNVEDIALGYSLVDENYWREPRKYMQTDATAVESVNAINDAMAAIRRGEKDVKVKVYRAVPSSVKEGKLRNGDWVTPSRAYAKMHGEHRLGGDYRIIEDEVPVNELWWDGNDSREWGFDDGKGYKYKNVENSRKLNDLVTRDDNGEIIAPSKRFDENVEDVRFREDNVKNPAEMSEEEKSSRGNQLLSVPAVNVESNQIVKTEEMSARRAAEKWWREHIGEPLFYDTEVGQVEINENSIGSSLAHRYGQAKLDAITSLKDGFKNAVYLGTMPDFVRQEGVQNHYFAYPIMYNGKRNYVFCRAMQDNNKNRLYVHEVFVADSIQNEGNTLQTAASQPHGGIALYKAILSDVLSAAKVGNNFETLQLSASEKAKQQAANDLAQQMHVEGEVEVVTSTEGLTGRQAKAKGWYDVRTGRVTIVLSNNKNAADVRETVFHEVVAHKGLRNLVGEEHFNTFLDNVYNNAEEGIKQTIDEMAEKKYDGDKRKATEEYMAHLAEDGEYVKPENQGFFAKVRDFLTDLLRKVGIKLGFKLTDNDLRYILWRSWKGLAERDGGSVFEKAEDVKMQHELGQTDEARSASGENGIMFREGSDELKDVVEKMKADVERLHEGELDDLRSGARAIGGRLSELNKAMRLQRAYDMSTVASVTELAKTMLKNGLLSEMSDYDVRRLLSVVNNVHGKGDIRPYVQKVVDMMVGNRLRNVSKAFDKLLAMRGKKVDARGVEVQGELDLAGQRMADVVWKGIGMSDDDVKNMCADAQDRMMSANGAEAAAAATDYAGWQIVKRYNETIRDSKSEEVQLREDLKRAKEDCDAGRMTREAYIEFRESANDAIRENRIERAEAYEDLYEQLGGAYGKSIKRAADFKAAEKTRVLEIQHNANSDMEGRPARSYRKDTAVDKVLNSSPIQLLFAPLGTFDQMLRMFGSKNVKGEGYLWNRYMRGWLTAAENEYTGYRDATAELDAKAAEVLGKGKTWADLFALERKLPKATVRVWDDGEMRGLELPQGNLLYIYMVNKMADGRMKLRKMGVTEDDVAAIEDFIDPRLKEIGDWLQEVYLVEKRGKYNEVYERMFGAAMASIDNYFPLKILKDARAENVDVGVEKRESEMASTITGSFIKRKRNALPLDLLNSDAFSVVLDHLQEMEHISAYAEWNRDLNTLLSYKHFRNQVKNMRSAYGSGERLWKAFNKVACIAAGTYDPPKALADKLAVNIAKGVTAAKILYRMFTAFKQLTSFPAYLSDSNPVYLLKGVANPYGSWKWCMENLPLFEKRWKSRMAGDPRLLKNEMDWSLWRDNVVQMAARWGMTPNAFVDALTVCIGARAMYETRRRKYIRYGYGLEEAERRAKQDASILYNQTQQSSEGAFLSALQVDRSWYSVMFTVFRNSSMSYTRQLYAALRNTGRRIAGGAEFKGISEAFMAKQMERDGIDPDRASKNAKAEYRKSWINDLVRAGVFGYVLQLLWNYSPYAIYMMFGDDEKKFEEIKHDVKTHTAWGFLEGLTGGDVWSAGLQSLWNHFVNGEDFNANSVNKDMPLTSDLLNVVKKVGSDNYGALNDVLNLLVQAGFGVNPQTLTDAAVAIYDYCGSDVETTKECALLVMRVMNCPQSQMDNIYFDEIDATGEEAKAMSVEEIAERYARYKALRSAPLRALSSDALKAAEKKPRERVMTEAKEQLDGRLMTEEAQRYLDEYEATKKKVTETRALADTDPKAFMQQMPALARSGEFRRYRRVGLYKSEVEKLTKKLLRTSDPAERRALFGKMLDARDKMLKQVREME